jgi:hypothetical protein
VGTSTIRWWSSSATKTEIIGGLGALIDAGAKASYVTALSRGIDRELRIVTDDVDPMAASLAGAVNTVEIPGIMTV